MMYNVNRIKSIKSPQSPINGFTMIELIMVIVILGILSATALPRFMDLSGSAKKAVLKKISGTIKSTVNLYVLSKRASGQSVSIKGQEEFYPDGTVNVNHGIWTWAGTPWAGSPGADKNTDPRSELSEAIDLDVNGDLMELSVNNKTPNPNANNETEWWTLYIGYRSQQGDTPSETTFVDSECYIKYRGGYNGNILLETVTEGC